MDYVLLSTVSAITGTMAMLLLYIYMYRLYREPYMGAWIFAWSFHLIRFCLFESGLLSLQNSTNFFFYLAILTIPGILFLDGAYLAIDKPLNKLWIVSAFGAFILGLIFNIMQLPVAICIAPAFLFAGPMLIYVGNIFINKLKVRGMGNYITGYAFILWGILTFIIPFYTENITYPRLITACCGVCRLVIATGILMVYFERTRNELAAKEAYYKRLAENCVDVVYYFSLLPKPKVEYVSPSIYRVLGYKPEEFYNDPSLHQKTIHPDDLWIFNAYIVNPGWCMDTPIEYRTVHKNKTIVYIEQNYYPVYDNAGNLIGRQGILRDVTARNSVKSVERKNDRLNIAGKMATAVAEYIRNPLVQLGCSLQLINDKYNHKERCRIIIEEIDKINYIISEYVLLEKDKKAELEECDLNNIIVTALPSLKEYASAHNTTIQIDLKELPTIYCDQYEISCLLLNMIRNAVEAMPSGGEITIHTKVDKEKVLLLISDTGCGVPGCILSNLGTPFLTTKGRGRGLGLPICYRIATRNQAEIKVSTGSQGTTFSIQFILPLAI